MIGHSIGEYVAACVAGVFSLDDALGLVAARGRLMQSLPPGAMLAVALPERELSPWLSEAVSLAAANSPTMSVLSGPADAIAEVEKRLEAKGVSCRRLETSHAFHSAMMDPVLDAFRAKVAGVRLKAPQIAFVSNVTGSWITDAEAVSPDYWTSHLRQPVRFAAGAEELLRDGARVLVEIGPGRTLTSLVRQQPAARGRTALTTVRHPQESESDRAHLLNAIGRLWVVGIAVDWARYFGAERRRRVLLPTYPFERQRYWADGPVRTAAAPSRRPLAKSPEIASWFYVPAWMTSPSPAPPLATVRKDDTSRWLVFVDDTGLGADLVARLRRDGHPVAAVRIGSGFASDGVDTYTLNPAAPADYDALIGALRADGRALRRIAHLWSVGQAVQDGTSIDAFAAAQARGFYSVLHLAQAIGRHRLADPIEVTVVGDGLHRVGDDEEEDTLSPEKATVAGLCLVLPQEFPNVRCGTLDIGPLAAGDRASMAERLSAELAAGPTGTAVAYRGLQRWTQTYRHTPVTPGSGSPALRTEGVYLITGGLGSVGLSIAELLVRKVRARLVLVGRSELPAREAWAEWIGVHGIDDPISRKVEAVRRIEALGAEVMIAGADVAGAGQLRAVMVRAKERFGAVHGVIHAAGIMRGGGLGPIASLDAEACELQFRPKVAGLYALDEAVAGLDLDFVLVTSSVAALLGGLGFGAYAAANQFMDSFVERKRAARGVRWISANLDAWDFGGGSRQTVTAELAMTASEGAESVARVIASGLARVVVSTADLDARLDRYVRVAPAPAARAASTSALAEAPRYARPELESAYAQPADDVEAAIAEVWQELLGIEQIGRDDNFFDLGGHSLLLVRVHAQLTERLGRQIAVTDLFRFPTIATLSAHVGGGRPARAAVAPAAEAHEAESNAIAIVGMACRLPGAPQVEAFWANLRDGVESIEALTEQDLRGQGVDDRLLSNPQYVRAASTIDGIDLFDAAFFGYSPREAELIDPQHRLFLECAWEAARARGLRPETLRGADRRVRRIQLERLSDQRRHERRRGAERRSPAGRPGHAKRLPADASVLQAEPARTERQRADGVLDVARRGPPGVPKPRRAGKRHGAGRRRVGQHAVEDRLLLRRGRHSVSRRPLPCVRREGAGDGLGQRRRRRRVEAAGRCDCRRRRRFMPSFAAPPSTTTAP